MQFRVESIERQSAVVEHVYRFVEVSMTSDYPEVQLEHPRIASFWVQTESTV